MPRGARGRPKSRSRRGSRARAGGLLEGVEEVAHGRAAFGEAAREVGALAEGAHAGAEELAALGVAVLLGDGVERAGDREEGLRARGDVLLVRAHRLELGDDGGALVLVGQEGEAVGHAVLAPLEHAAA